MLTFEQFVAELSKKTLKSYVKKAADDTSSYEAGTLHGRTPRTRADYRRNQKKATKLFNKASNRGEGISKAVDRLTK